MAKKATRSVSKRSTKSKATTKTAKAAPKKVKKVAKAKPKPTPKKSPAKKIVVPKKKTVKKTVKKAVKKTSKKVTKPYCPAGYTTSEYEKFCREKARLSGFGNQALKDILRKNLQSMSGNKEDLILKVTDGIVLGRIPRCPNCFGGRPKYDYKTGVYTCPGYRDDEDYKNCNSKFRKEDLKRDPWE